MKKDVGIVLEVILIDLNAVLRSAPPSGQLSFPSAAPVLPVSEQTPLLGWPDPILGFYQSGGNGLEFTDLIGAVWAEKKTPAAA